MVKLNLKPIKLILTDIDGVWTDSKFYYYAKKPTSGLKAKDKLRMKKYNPATKKHEWFVEKKLPPHSK